MNPLFYSYLPTRFGKISIFWEETGKKSKIHRIILPSQQKPLELFDPTIRPVYAKSYPPAIRSLMARMKNYLKGKAVDLKLDMISLDRCPLFQRKVLLAEYRIPRGYISAYGRIAKKLRVSGGARAVGNALANNPFPIIIPCHRAIRSNGELGGYQGGLTMKRYLLEMEGIRFARTGKVVMDKIFY